jgi:hypothetical protein
MVQVKMQHDFDSLKKKKNELTNEINAIAALVHERDKTIQTLQNETIRLKQLHDAKISDLTESVQCAHQEAQQTKDEHEAKFDTSWQQHLKDHAIEIASKVKRARQECLAEATVQRQECQTRHDEALQSVRDESEQKMGDTIMHHQKEEARHEQLHRQALSDANEDLQCQMTRQQHDFDTKRRAVENQFNLRQECLETAANEWKHHLDQANAKVIEKEASFHAMTIELNVVKQRSALLQTTNDTLHANSAVLADEQSRKGQEAHRLQEELKESRQQSTTELTNLNTTILKEMNDTYSKKEAALKAEMVALHQELRVSKEKATNLEEETRILQTRSEEGLHFAAETKRGLEAALEHEREDRAFEQRQAQKSHAQSYARLKNAKTHLGELKEQLATKQRDNMLLRKQIAQVQQNTSDRVTSEQEGDARAEEIRKEYEQQTRRLKSKCRAIISSCNKEREAAVSVQR